jgi:hypothetical protein
LEKLNLEIASLNYNILENRTIIYLITIFFFSFLISFAEGATNELCNRTESYFTDHAVDIEHKTDSEVQCIIDCYKCCVGEFDPDKNQQICTKFHNYNNAKKKKKCGCPN